MSIAAIPGIDAQGDLAAVAARLRRSTVEVRGRGPGGGSGVIWGADGLIITNAHVAHSDEAMVSLWDGREFPARLMNRDPQRDLAALVVEAHDLPAAPVGDSSALRVGELVLAVGHPLGVVGALTAGIIHALGATGPGGQHWVQADLRLAPGNSGGPMADARGRVIGINTMIGGGLALAVPSAAIERFLVAHNRPTLGIVMQPVALPGSGAPQVGLLVVGVDRGGAAEASGLLIGDIVVGANDRRLAEPGDLNVALREAAGRDGLTLDLMRGGRRLTLSVAFIVQGKVAA